MRVGLGGITGTGILSIGRGVSVGGGGGWTPPTNAIVMDTTSTSAAWTPPVTPVKTGGTMTWYVADSDGKLLAKQTANKPTFDLSGYPGTQTIYVESPDGWTGLTDVRLYSLGITRLDIGVATGLLRLDCWANSPLAELDVSSLAALRTFYAFNCNLAAVDLSQNLAIRDIRLEGNAMTQQEVDDTIASIYNARMSYTDATPSLSIGGNNAAPSGTYQYSANPTTGLEMIYALVENDDDEPRPNWTITYTAP